MFRLFSIIEESTISIQTNYLEVGVAAIFGDGGSPNRCMKDDRICCGLRNNRACSTGDALHCIALQTKGVMRR